MLLRAVSLPNGRWAFSDSLFLIFVEYHPYIRVLFFLKWFFYMVIFPFYIYDRKKRYQPLILKALWYWATCERYENRES